MTHTIEIRWEGPESVIDTRVTAILNKRGAWHVGGDGGNRKVLVTVPVQDHEIGAFLGALNMLGPHVKTTHVKK